MEDPLATMSTCPSCDALNVQRAVTCAECGAKLGARPDDAVEEKRARLAAARGLGDLRKSLRAVRTLYRLQAGVAAFALIVTFVAADDIDVVTAVASTFVVGVIVLSLVAAHQIFDKPLLWSLMLAFLTTLAIVIDPANIGFFDVLFATFSWFAVSSVLRARSTMRDYPDIWEKSAGREALAARRERTDDEGVRARVGRRYKSSTLQVVLVIVAMIVITTIVRWAATRTPSLDDPRAAFEQAWHDEDVAAIAALFAPESRGRMQAAMTSGFDKRGWSDNAPDLVFDRAETSSGGKRAVVSYLTREGMVSVTWVFEEAWRVHTLRFPKRR